MTENSTAPQKHNNTDVELMITKKRGLELDCDEITSKKHRVGDEATSLTGPVSKVEADTSSTDAIAVLQAKSNSLAVSPACSPTP